MSSKLTFHILDVVARDETIVREDEETQEVDYESMEEDDPEIMGSRTNNNGKSAWETSLQKKNIVIHLFGATASGKTVRLDVRGFEPFFYLALPEKLTAPVGRYIIAIRRYIATMLGPDISSRVSLSSIKKKVLFGFTADREYPFVEVRVPSLALFRQVKDLFLNSQSKPILSQKECLACPTRVDAKAKRCGTCGYRFCFKHKDSDGGHDCRLCRRTPQDILIKKHEQLGTPFPNGFVLKVFEANLDPFLRFLHLRNIKPCGWVTAEIPDDGTGEYSCEWNEVGPCVNPPALTAPFKVASWDIECFSESGEFPMAKNGDPIIQIGTILTILGSNKTENHIFTLGSCDELPGTVVHAYQNEKALLRGWLNWINAENVDILIGYNIFGFDEKYLWERCEALGLTPDDCVQDLNRLSSLGGEMRLDTKRLSSSAMGDNFLYLWNSQGRLRIDLYHVIKRGYALGSYKLDDTSRTFLSSAVKGIEINKESKSWKLAIGSSTKQDVTVGRSIVLLNENGDTLCEKVELLECGDGYLTIHAPFEVEVDEVAKWAVVKDDVTPQDMFRLQKGSSADRATIAKYCVQDCQLVLELFRKLDVFNNSMSMANVCSVPVAYIFLRGQGIKIESLMFKYCYEQGQAIEVLPQPSYGTASEDGEQDSYEGAIVLDPEPGFYTVPVGVADFASLYPSTIISENISHDTLVWVKDYDKDGRLISLSWGSDEFDSYPGERYTDISFDLMKPDPEDKRKHPQKICVGLRVCRYAQNRVGTIPRIVDGLLKARSAKRAEIKKASDPFVKALLDSEQLAYKLTANSLYGQLGSGCFKVRHQALAASVTAYGRKQIMFAKSIIEDFYGPGSGNKNSSAKIVYGDTDSLFIAFHPKNPETGVPLEGREALEATIHLTEEAGKLVTQVLKPPHDFEFDKVYWPFLIFSKKRYVGHKYEEGPDHYSLASMGVALKRRDYAPIVKKIYGGAIHILLTEKDVPKAAEFVKTTALDLVDGKFGLNPLTISKSLRAEYANPNAIAHKVLADRIAVRDPGNAPASGDRIAYVYVQPAPGQKAPDLQGDRIETPAYIKSNGLKPDYMYYIDHQISNPVCQMFGLLLHLLPEAKGSLKGLPSDPDKAAVARESIAYDILFGKASQRNKTGATRAFLSMLGAVMPSSVNPVVQRNEVGGEKRRCVRTAGSIVRKQSTLDSMFIDKLRIDALKEKEKSEKKEKAAAAAAPENSKKAKT